MEVIPLDGPMHFINKWNASNDAKRMQVFLRPETQNGCAHESDNLFGIDVRFPSNGFKMDAETFDELRNRVYTSSKGLMQVMTSVDSFRTGVMYIAVLFCNHGYTPKIIAKTLDFLMNEVFPDLAK